MKRPTRKFELDIHIQGDNLADLSEGLRYIVTQTQRRLVIDQIGGAPGHDFVLRGTIHPDQTPENYLSEMSRYLKGAYK